MRILVTGGSGFVGRHLVPRLTADGNDVRVVQRGPKGRRLEATLSAFEGIAFDTIIHLAAWTQAGDFCRTRGGEQWIVNQQINTDVLRWWCEKQPRAKMVAMGTSVSYSTETGLTEDKYMVGEPKMDYYAYAMTKRMLYAGLVALGGQFGLRYLYLVPSTLYGPDYPIDGRRLHFIYDLIRKILRGREFGEKVLLWGDGHQKRELVFMDDFVNILVDLTGRVDNDLINVGAGEERSIREFAEILCAITGFDFGRIEFDETQHVGARSKCLSTKKLESLLGRVNRTSLEDGLRRTVEWCMGPGRKLWEG